MTKQFTVRCSQCGEDIGIDACSAAGDEVCCMYCGAKAKIIKLRPAKLRICEEPGLEASKYEESR